MQMPFTIVFYTGTSNCEKISKAPFKIKTLQIVYFYVTYNWLFKWFFYKEGRSQRLQREEAKERHHDKKAMAAESWYLMHNFPAQRFTFEWPDVIKISVTLAAEHAAASDRNERTCNVIVY